MSPIRPEMKDKYPANWEEIRANILYEAGDACEWCGAKNYTIGDWLDAGGFLIDNDFSDYFGEKSIPKAVRAEMKEQGLKQLVLTIAHLDHNPENNDRANLKALCQRCHNEHDAPARRSGILRRKAEREGQNDLFLE